MIGERTSKQITGNMLMDSIKVDQHQYYCEIMDLSLLPHIKDLLIILIKEAINVSNASSESFMFWYHKQLTLSNEK